MQNLIRTIPLLLAVNLASGACTLPSSDATAPPRAAIDDAQREVQRTRAAQVFGTLPTEFPSEANPITEAKVTLGRALYYEPRLSRAGDLSCNSCHQLSRFGVDNEPTSPGDRGQRGGRNSPTVYNAALHVAQFWDGRAADVEEQAKGPILNPIEMAMPGEAEVVARLASIPGYVEMFGAAFPDEAEPLSYDNLARAIGAFERRLAMPSRFDDFLAGDLAALSDAEVDGLRAFVDSGCVSCHVGPGLGGQLYQKLGLVHPYETQDVGREEVTGLEADRYVFKVPSLRNVAETGPWFHDGSLTELDEVVRLMAWHQVGRELSDEDAAAIVTFLKSLTGRIDAELVAKPVLPGESAG